MKQLILLVLLIVLIHVDLSNQNKCIRALQGQQKCDVLYSMLQPKSRSTVCRWQRMRFINRCLDLLVEEEFEPNCTSDCRKMLEQLDRKLDNFLLCECNNDMECIWFQERTIRCFNQTLKYKKNCDIERQKCEKDQMCYSLYADWFKQCQDMFTGYKCTKECLLAEEQLYSNPIGQSLKTCECAGNKNRDKFCRSVRINREKVCSNKDVNEIENPYSNYDKDDIDDGLVTTGQQYLNDANSLIITKLFLFSTILFIYSL